MPTAVFICSESLSKPTCVWFSAALNCSLAKTVETIQQIHMQTLTAWSLKIYIYWIGMESCSLKLDMRGYHMLWKAILHVFDVNQFVFLKTSNSIAGDYEYL